MGIQSRCRKRLLWGTHLSPDTPPLHTTAICCCCCVGSGPHRMLPALTHGLSVQTPPTASTTVTFAYRCSLTTLHAVSENSLCLPNIIHGFPTAAALRRGVFFRSKVGFWYVLRSSIDSQVLLVETALRGINRGDCVSAGSSPLNGNVISGSLL